ncbi:oxidoreductase [Hymenobacter fodinae]|uniref:Probable oxidoreductase n=1 Tax=Hymenobacter fodinae TaxID=2510796 RepID=A0A4Z0NZC5_9BACT|nr:oxidoreductase [Hymenobacter fodinae]TGE03769.1 SDR family NAD(P)-dependent oxidoreductase [Hymenobacter fodinae]
MSNSAPFAAAYQATAQQPLGSGFTAASTAADVIRGLDLTGKIALVTGGHAGLGLETVRALHGAGAHVLVPARDPTRAADAMLDLPGVEVETLDLLDPASIDALAARFLASGRPLHLLVLSAGIMANPLARDARGYESQLATNHLGHFQLTGRLWPALRQAQGARVVAVSSRGHRLSPVRFDDPNFERHAYDPWVAYGQSKTANVLFARGLDRRGHAAGIRAFSLHPGSIAGTGLSKYVTPEQLRQMGAVDAAGNIVVDPARGLKTAAQGAATSVWCATSPQLAGLGGVYCEDNDVATIYTPDDSPTPRAMTGVMPYAVDEANADRLWTLSEQLTGTIYPH